MSTRIVFDPERRWGTTPVFEGTRQSPEDIAGEIEGSDDDAWIAESWGWTVEQVRAAREWLAAHPDCVECGGTGQPYRSRYPCKACKGHGRRYSFAETQEREAAQRETERIWRDRKPESQLDEGGGSAGLMGE